MRSPRRKHAKVKLPGLNWGWGGQSIFWGPEKGKGPPEQAPRPLRALWAQRWESVGSGASPHMAPRAAPWSRMCRLGPAGTGRGLGVWQAPARLWARGSSGTRTGAGNMGESGNRTVWGQLCWARDPASEAPDPSSSVTPLQRGQAGVPVAEASAAVPRVGWPSQASLGRGDGYPAALAPGGRDQEPQ